MSARTPVMSHWLRFSGRRNRLSFFLQGIAHSLISVAVVIAILFASGFFGALSGYFALLDQYDGTIPASIEDAYSDFVIAEYGLRFLWLLAFIPLILWNLLVMAAVMCQRLHDIGLSGWLGLLTVPLTLLTWAGWLLFCLVPGQKQENQYGPDPLAHNPDPVFRSSRATE